MWQHSIFEISMVKCQMGNKIVTLADSSIQPQIKKGAKNVGESIRFVVVQCTTNCGPCRQAHAFNSQTMQCSETNSTT